jgi:HD-GYP domain-containing protein (c-di-GMP phosphodiesterase class II)
MVAALASALARRDPQVAAHCARVTLLAERLAAWLGWDDVRLARLRLGGPLHDIGKVTISPALLSKSGPLAPNELAQIRTHPAAGAKLINPIAPERHAIPYALYHHERWDGGGYPTGLGGEEIPDGVRLLSVVDAFDAMTSTRPYSRAMPTRVALAEIERCSGSQFDPAFAHAFLEAWDAGALELTEQPRLRASSGRA